MLKLILTTTAFAFLASTAAVAEDANTKWINQCILDNTDQGQTSEVLKSYCACMNFKMDENETRSVTEWEKSHETEAVECENKAGWVAK